MTGCVNIWNTLLSATDKFKSIFLHSARSFAFLVTTVEFSLHGLLSSHRVERKASCCRMSNTVVGSNAVFSGRAFCGSGIEVEKQGTPPLKKTPPSLMLAWK